MTDMLYHGDPDDCTHADDADAFDYRTGLCTGHPIPRPPSPCACHRNSDDACPNHSTDSFCCCGLRYCPLGCVRP